ncbi:MAG: hypothetical protein HY033_02825 [Ignavibacteriae bacterium]|nr:hypothetical protein [Ignavibacteria bacterium]MBI3363821.1 hypothetical protein [Ignavibacteriota bacterium]
MRNAWFNQCAAANRRYAIQFVSHWFYNIIGFGGRALPAAVVELGRYMDQYKQCWAVVQVQCNSFFCDASVHLGAGLWHKGTS